MFAYFEVWDQLIFKHMSPWVLLHFFSKSGEIFLKRETLTWFRHYMTPWFVFMSESVPVFKLLFMKDQHTNMQPIIWHFLLTTVWDSCCLLCQNSDIGVWSRAPPLQPSWLRIWAAAKRNAFLEWFLNGMVLKWMAPWTYRAVGHGCSLGVQFNGVSALEQNRGNAPGTTGRGLQKSVHSTCFLNWLAPATAVTSRSQGSACCQDTYSRGSGEIALAMTAGAHMLPLA